MKPVKRTLMMALLAMGAMAADPAPRAPKTKAEIDQQLTAITQRQMELSFMLRDQIKKNETLWMDPQYTSPEIVKLRKRLEVVKMELTQLQSEIRKRVEEIPAAQAELAKADNDKAEHQTLARRVEELRKQREQAP